MKAFNTLSPRFENEHFVNAVLMLYLSSRPTHIYYFFLFTFIICFPFFLSLLPNFKRRSCFLSFQVEVCGVLVWGMQLLWGLGTQLRGAADAHLSAVCTLSFFFCNIAVYEAKLDVWNSFPLVGAHSSEPPPQQVPRGFRWVGKYNQIECQRPSNCVS